MAAALSQRRSRCLGARKGVVVSIVRTVSVIRSRARQVPVGAALCALLLVLTTPLRPTTVHGPISAVVDIAPQIVALDARTGRAFIAVHDLTQGLVAVADERTGLVRRIVDVGADQTIAGIDIDARRGHVFVTVAPTDTPGIPSHARAGLVLMLDARTGAVLHRTRVGPDPAPTPLDAQRGRLLVFSDDAASVGRATTIDTATGRALHTVTLGPVGPTSDPGGVAGAALDETRGRLFTVTRHAATYAVSVLDTATGALVHTLGLGAHPNVVGISVIADAPLGRALVGLDGRIFVLDAHSGCLVRMAALAVSMLTIAGDARTGRVFAADAGRIFVLDARDGRVLHTTVVPAAIGAYDLAVVAATGRVLLLTPRADATGTGEVDSLSVLDATTGALLGTTSLGMVGDGRSGYGIAAVDARTNRVFLIAAGAYKDGQYTGPGTVLVVDTRTGRVRARAMIGNDPWDIVVDPRTGAAFVSDQPTDVVLILNGLFGTTITPPQHTVQHKRTPIVAPFPRAVPLTGAGVVMDERTGRAFVGVARGVSVLDTASGSVLHTTSLGGLPKALALDAAAGRVYAALFDADRIAVLDARSGALLHTVRIAGHPQVLALAPGGGRLFVGARDDPRRGAGGGVSMLDTRRDIVLWTVKVRGTRPDPGALAVDEQPAHVVATDTTARAPTTGIVSTLAISNGRILHTVEISSAYASNIVVAGGHVFIPADDGVRVLDARTGTQLRPIQPPPQAANVAVDATRQRVLVTDGAQTDSALYIVDARRGIVLHRTELDPHLTGRTPASIPVLDTSTSTGRVYVLMVSPTDENESPTGPAAVAVVDATTGALRRIIILSDTVSPTPGASSSTHSVAVDMRAHRLIVLTDTHAIVLDTTHL